MKNNYYKMKIKYEDRELMLKCRKYQIFKDLNDKIIENTMGINLNEIHIKYEMKKEDNQLRVFGENFIKNNDDNCKIILNGIPYKLQSQLNIKKTTKKLIEIKLRGIKTIIYAKEMFYKCSSLKSLPDIPKWNTNNITNMSGLFGKCSSL